MPSIDSVTSRMRDISERGSIPSNIAEMLEDACEELENEDNDLSVRVNAAASILDEISNDPNIKQHTRTEIWNLASEFESLED